MAAMRDLKAYRQISMDFKIASAFIVDIRVEIKEKIMNFKFRLICNNKAASTSQF